LETKAIYNSQTGKDLESCDEKQSDRKTSISKTREREGEREGGRERVECKTKRQSTKVSEPKKPTSRKHTIKQKERNFKLKGKQVEKSIQKIEIQKHVSKKK
jgi:hypothetical protein